MKLNLFNLEKKVIAITGGYGVLGRSIVKYLAHQKATVIILGRSKSKGEALVDEIRKTAQDAEFIEADVMDLNSLENARSKILERHHRLDVLINAAGGNMPGASIPEKSTIFDLNLDSFKEVVDLNLFGTVLPTMVFAKAMVDVGAGNVINFASESALRPLSRVVGYGVAKAAVVNFTRYMAGELALKFGNNFRVNAIAPGFFISEQNRSLLQNEDGSLTARGKTILAHTPFQRFGEPDELHGSIHYLASDASKFVTGTVLVVDGGFDAFSI